MTFRLARQVLQRQCSGAAARLQYTHLQHLAVGHDVGQRSGPCGWPPLADGHRDAAPNYYLKTDTIPILVTA
jgi:hypothetical protein